MKLGSRKSSGHSLLSGSDLRQMRRTNLSSKNLVGHESVTRSTLLMREHACTGPSVS